MFSFLGETTAGRHNHRSLKGSKTPRHSPWRTRSRHLLVVSNLRETEQERRRTAHEPGKQELGSWWLTICSFCNAELYQVTIRKATDVIWYICNCARSHVRVSVAMGGNGEQWFLWHSIISSYWSTSLQYISVHTSLVYTWNRDERAIHPGEKKVNQCLKIIPPFHVMYIYTFKH